MADDLLDLTDLTTINDKNLSGAQATDLIDDAPLLAALGAEPASDGNIHKYTKESGAPVVGFRAPNTGRDLSSSADTLVTVNLKILDASFGIDKAVADAYVRGGPMALVDREWKRHLKKAYADAEAQIINGILNDSEGFVGLKAASTINGLSDAMVYNAGGSAAGSGDTLLSSVYLIRTNNDGTDVAVVAGMEGQISVGETVEQLLTDADGKKYPAYTTSIIGWLGLQIGGAYSVGRIANLNATSTHTLTDAMIYEALALFPASRQPNLIVMNRRSLKQLRASRTATNQTGAPAPRPVEVDGIPIVVTEAIGVNDAAVS